jgi:ribosomal protein L37AE/L43A
MEASRRCFGEGCMARGRAESAKAAGPAGPQALRKARDLLYRRRAVRRVSSGTVCTRPRVYSGSCRPELSLPAFEWCTLPLRVHADGPNFGPVSGASYEKFFRSRLTRNCYLWDPALAGLVRLKADPQKGFETTDHVSGSQKKGPVSKQLASDEDNGVQLAQPPCPFCGSSKVKPPTEKVDASSYWRCETCGQMWNAGRLQSSSRSRYGGR